MDEGHQLEPFGNSYLIVEDRFIGVDSRIEVLFWLGRFDIVESSSTNVLVPRRRNRQGRVLWYRHRGLSYC